VTKSFAALICIVAVALLGATGAQGCGNPGDALMAEPVSTKAESSGPQAATKDQPATLQGTK
jgi:hypothetical protein